MIINRIRNIGPNKTEIHFTNGAIAFQSYDTLVAAHIPGEGYIRVDEFYSVTTSKHVNAWIGGYKARKVSRAEFDRLINS